MKGKFYTLGAGSALLILGWMNDTWFRLVLLIVACLYFFLAGTLFERYPTETGRQRHFEISIAELVKMSDPRAETYTILQNCGFDMSAEITWWDDPMTNNRIFTQEVK